MTFKLCWMIGNKIKTQLKTEYKEKMQQLAAKKEEEQKKLEEAKRKLLEKHREEERRVLSKTNTTHKKLFSAEAERIRLEEEAKERERLRIEEEERQKRLREEEEERQKRLREEQEREERLRREREEQAERERKENEERQRLEEERKKQEEEKKKQEQEKLERKLKKQKEREERKAKGGKRLLKKKKMIGVTTNLGMANVLWLPSDTEILPMAYGHGDLTDLRKFSPSFFVIPFSSISKKKSALREDQVQYGLMRLSFGAGRFRRSHWVFFLWTPDSMARDAPPRLRTKKINERVNCANMRGAMEKLIGIEE
ncbi:trichohyalin [Reticulomyxa filosa]|uniref:Trichohyalin n=1 Tax=Reticulomyxa filosa TaxID=46433 RepID=X6NEX5_RETFI|nr:trichohyalin [Reticulomyxa filosa]|eukprot:ETO24314.1 trichohyalin [Reticulomyxa filosa]